MQSQAGKVELVPAGVAEKPLLANLLELYCHDFSEFVALQPGIDGRFGYPHLDAYFREPNHHAFLIHFQGETVGFVFVRGVNLPAAAWDMAEFFILRGFRRHGVGIRAACEVFHRFPGTWQVRVMLANSPACTFWARAVEAFTGRAVAPAHTIHDGKPWQIFRLESAAPQR